MELKEFVKEALVQIADGIKEAQDSCRNLGCRINPRYKNGTANIMRTPDDAPVSEVKFKIGLTSETVSSDKKGIGVAFSNLTIGAMGEHGANQSSVTSVEFSIPVAFPNFK